MKKYAILLALILVAACKSSENSAPANPDSATAANPSPAAVGNPPASTTNSAASARSAIDVCSLLTSGDLRSVQGETYQQAQSSDRQEGDFIVAQCYYQMPTMANSVVLNFTTPKQGASRRPRVLWNETFHQTVAKDRNRQNEREKEKVRERDGDEDERGSPPERVEGLGQEAFWIAGRVGGALYVLHDDNRFFRISVGGGDNATAKLNKSKKLAQLVLKRLGPLVPEG